jgi:hypothetical protein
MLAKSENPMNVLELNQATADFFLHEQNREHLKTSFNFLKEHSGWRPGNVHLLIAPTHAGKSTWVRSVLWDIVTNNGFHGDSCSIGVHLSEESVDEFRLEVSKMRIPWDELSVEISVRSEQDETISEQSVNMWMKENEFDIVIMDNITTSELYNNKNNKGQYAFAKNLKRWAQETKSTMLIIAHSDGKALTKNSLIEENNIRGDKSLPNLAQFCYALQRFYIRNAQGKEVYYTILRTLKHRGYNCKNTLHQLVYNPATFSFQSDNVIPWEAFKTAYEARLKL